MIFDLHNDLVTARLSWAQKREKAHTTADEVIYACWTTRRRKPSLLIAHSAYILGRHRIAIEDMGFVAADTTPLWERYPLAYAGLTHNDDNALAGGATGSGRMTPLGKEIVRKLNAARVPLDLSHLNRASFYDVLGCAERVLVSHTGWMRICEHPRNLDDTQVLEVLRRGGVVGIAAVRDFLGGDDVLAYACAIDRFVQHFGIDGVCIGSDFYGTEFLKGLRRYEDFDAVAQSLHRFGYTAQDIAKIFHENAAAYFHAA